MPLQSALLKSDSKLQACLQYDSAHVTQGAVGEHVARIQAALAVLDSATIDSAELKDKRYGPSTAAAVLSYKQKRQIINLSYQAHADNIVGKMTIAALDRELLSVEGPINSLAGSVRQYIDLGRTFIRSPSPAIQSLGHSLEPGLRSLDTTLSGLLESVGLPRTGGTGPAPRTQLNFIVSVPLQFAIRGQLVFGAADAAIDSDLFRALVAGITLLEIAGAAIAALGLIKTIGGQKFLENARKKLEDDAKRAQVELADANVNLARRSHAEAKRVEQALEDCKNNNPRKAECLRTALKAFGQALSKLFTNEELEREFPAIVREID